MGEQCDNRTLHRALAEQSSLDDLDGLKLLCRDADIDSESGPYLEHGIETYPPSIVDAFRHRVMPGTLLSECTTARPEVIFLLQRSGTYFSTPAPKLI